MGSPPPSSPPAPPTWSEILIAYGQLNIPSPINPAAFAAINLVSFDREFRNERKSEGLDVPRQNMNPSQVHRIDEMLAARSVILRGHAAVNQPTAPGISNWRAGIAGGIGLTSAVLGFAGTHAFFGIPASLIIGAGFGLAAAAVTLWPKHAGAGSLHSINFLRTRTSSPIALPAGFLVAATGALYALSQGSGWLGYALAGTAGALTYGLGKRLGSSPVMTIGGALLLGVVGFGIYQIPFVKSGIQSSGIVDSLRSCSRNMLGRSQDDMNGSSCSAQVTGKALIFGDQDDTLDKGRQQWAGKDDKVDFYGKAKLSGMSVISTAAAPDSRWFISSNLLAPAR